MNMHAHHLTRHQVIALLEERDNLEWCRRAWRALQGASYADAVRHAQTYRPRKAA